MLKNRVKKIAKKLNSNDGIEVIKDGKLSLVKGGKTESTVAKICNTLYDCSFNFSDCPHLHSCGANFA